MKILRNPIYVLLALQLTLSFQALAQTPPTASSGYTIEHFALSGDPAPGGAFTFAGLGEPSINDQGAIAFYGTLFGVTPVQQTAVYSNAIGNGVGELSRIVGWGDAAPGYFPVFDGASWAFLTNDGSIVFQGYGPTEDGRKPGGVYLYRPYGEVVTIADGATLRPGTDEVFTKVFMLYTGPGGGTFPFTAHNATGTLNGSYLANIDDGSGSIVLSEIATVGDDFTSLNTGTVPSQYFVNDLAVVVMSLARETTLYRYTREIYVLRPGEPLTRLTDAGDVGPDGETLRQFSTPRINNLGQIAFIGYSDAGLAIYLLDTNGSIQKLISTADEVPNQPDMRWHSFRAMQLADDGTVVFTALYEKTQGLPDLYAGIYILSENGLQVVFDPRDGLEINGEHISLPPLNRANYGEYCHFRVGSRFVNNALEVAFLQAYPSGLVGNFCDRSGVFVARPATSATEIGEGTTFEEGVVIGDHANIGQNVQFKRDVTVGDYFVAGDEVIIEFETVIGNYVTLGYKVKLEEKVVVGNRVQIGDETVVKKEAMIEDDVRIGDSVTIEDGASIGNCAEIGDGAKIGKNAEIGDRATVAAGADVPDDAQVPPGATCPGP